MNFFTDPYEDELIYSAIARDSWYSGIGKTNTLRKLFGRPIHIDFEYSYYMNILAEKLGGKYTTHYLIEHHTTLGFYLLGFDRKRRDSILQKIESGEKINFRYILHLDSMYNQENSSLNYCPICVQEDYKKYKECFFHREHQIPGVVVCPKHGVELYEYKHYTKRDCLYNLIRLEYNECNTNQDTIKKVPAANYEKLLLYAKCAQRIVKGELRGIDREKLREKYMLLLKKKGFSTARGFIRHDRLMGEFIEFYGTDLLNLLGCTINEKQNNNCWVFKITWNGQGVLNPVKHILFMCFLESDLDKLFAEFHTKIEKEVSECLNRFCINYKKKKVANIQVISAYNRKYNTSYPFKLYTCEQCGFAYSKKTGEVTNENIVIRHFGSIWKEELKKCLANNLSEEDILEKMECNLKTLSIAKKHLTLEADKELLPVCRFGWSHEIQDYKNMIIDTIKEYPTATRTEIRSMIPGAYKKIRDVDPEWFNQVLPKRSSGWNDKGVNWGEMDIETEKRLEEVYRECLKIQPPIQITGKVIIGMLGMKVGTFITRLNFMPLTSKLYRNIIEDRIKFKIRKCKWIVDQLVLEQDVVTITDVVKEMGTRIDRMNNVKEQINEYINNKLKK